MADYKLLGSNDPVTNELGSINQGIGFEILPIDLAANTQSFQVRDYFGWAIYADGFYTSRDPRPLTVGTYQVTIDGLASTDETNLPNGSPSFWDVSTSRIPANGEGTAYAIYFSSSIEVDGTSAEIRLKVMGENLAILSSQTLIIDSSQTVFEVPFNAVCYSSSVFPNNYFYIEIDVVSVVGGTVVNLFQSDIFISRIS